MKRTTWTELFALVSESRSIRELEDKIFEKVREERKREEYDRQESEFYDRYGSCAYFMDRSEFPQFDDIEVDMSDLKRIRETARMRWDG